MHNTLQQKRLVINICQNIMNLQLNLIQYRTILFLNMLLLLNFVAYKSYLHWSSVPKTSSELKVTKTEINNTFEFKIYYILLTE